MFDGFQSEWDFVKSYHAQFGLMPDKGTFLTQFPDFEFEDTEASAQWLADEVAQDILDGKIRQKLEELDSLRQLNPRDVIDRMQDALLDLRPYAHGSIRHDGDLWDMADIAAEAQRRRENPDKSGITLGFELLDEVTNGSQPGAIETYFARPGIGKSLVLLYGAYAASQQGRKGLYFSPEMDKFETGVRFTAYNLHVSAFELMGGLLPDDEWIAYLTQMQKLKRGAPILFYEPTTLGGQITTAHIARAIAIEKPDFVCVDGVMLTMPRVIDKDIRKTIFATMKELKDIAVETHIPIRVAHQANRNSESNRPRRGTSTVDELIPALHHMAESGSVEQFTNVAIGLAKLRGRLHLAVRKNRNAPTGRIISVSHDVDRGRIREAMIVHGNTEIDDAAPANVEMERGAHPEHRF
jgi:replicative DNA helicase